VKGCALLKITAPKSETAQEIAAKVLAKLTAQGY